jgi:hypothetical protein
MTADPRRARSIAIAWNSEGTIGRITIDGQYWAAVEWSEERQAWCIEDAEGKCLAHKSHIHGQGRSKEAAVALAGEMIRDGRMPSPEQSAQAARARREQRRRQPAQIRKREERRQRDQAWSAAYQARWQAEWADKAEQPLVEALADAFDFADPDLWKSNSWAAMRPRLILHQRALIARLESEHATAVRTAATEPFGMYQSKEDRDRSRAARQASTKAQIAEIDPKLCRAREILQLLEKGGTMMPSKAAPDRRLDRAVNRVLTKR